MMKFDTRLPPVMKSINADLKKKFAEFAEGDKVMVLIQPERYPKDV